jgi:predicted Fe-Mo cluster-binding NifX family protein
MKVIVTAEGNDLNAPTSPRFGRCPTYVLVETETLAFEAIPNPASSASGGAGILAAQFIVEQGAQAVLTGNVGPNAADVLKVANILVYLNSEPNVRAAVEAFKAGRLPAASGATVKAHAGLRMGPGRAADQSAVSATEREQEIAALKFTTAELRQGLADALDRIEKLEKEN